MCRLFGFRSVILSQVHHSLMRAENALETQSQDHPHGWGVAYYVAGTPHVIKSDKSALNDQLFRRVSGIVSSQTVIAHIRNATEGEVNLLNTHPFQFGPWVFAHNGNIKEFATHRTSLINEIAPALRPYVLGETDSELIFFLILTELLRKVDLSRADPPFSTVLASTRLALSKLEKIIGQFFQGLNGTDKETYLTFILTNGKTMLAHQGGKQLFYSTYKNRCVDRDHCKSFSAACENKSEDGYVNHLLFASEPLSGENIWLPLGAGEIKGVDQNMKLNQDR
jgi:predicted glutamine amidotransferase